MPIHYSGEYLTDYTLGFSRKHGSHSLSVVKLFHSSVILLQLRILAPKPSPSPLSYLKTPIHIQNRGGGGHFPGGAVVKNPPANAGDTGLSPGPGRSHMPRSN